MPGILFTNVSVFDGSGAQPYRGEVLVEGNRIRRVVRGARNVAFSGLTVVDGAGATLMPGMTEAHTHFSWNDQPSLTSIQRMPTEEHMLWCAHIAKRYLDMGWTSAVGAATAKPRLDVVLRNAIDAGQVPGPRYCAASQEITVPGGLADETKPHIPYPEFSFGAVVSGAEEMRRCARMFLKYGVDTLKLNLSGEYIAGIPAELLRRRPDICMAERQAAAQSAQIGIAEAQLARRRMVAAMDAMADELVAVRDSVRPGGVGVAAG